MTNGFFSRGKATSKKRRIEMTLCPIAIAVGCKKCFLFDICFLKTILGDYKKVNVKQDQTGETTKVIEKESK